MRRLTVVAHFDPDAVIAPHVRRQLQELSTVSSRLIVVTTNELDADSREFVTGLGELTRRINYGHDFLGWKEAIDAHWDPADYDELLLTNDSYVGPLVPASDIVGRMADHPADFWGITLSERRRRHVQSYFVAFKSNVMRSQAFARFWSRYEPSATRADAIAQGELGLSRALITAGFTAGSYFEPDAEETALGERRQRWWAERRAELGVVGTGRPKTVDEFAAEPPNPASAFADSALHAARLPVVKFDVLRYDPYWLDSGALLDRLERIHPAHFDGVREFLRRTAAHYPGRPGENSGPHPLREPEASEFGYAR